MLSSVVASYLCLQAQPLLCCSELDALHSLPGSLTPQPLRQVRFTTTLVGVIAGPASIPDENQEGLEVPMRIFISDHSILSS